MGIASVVVGFATLIASFAVSGEADVQMVADVMRQQGQPLPVEDARTLYTAVVVGVFAFMAVVAALWIMFLFFMRAGRNWARIVVTAVGVVWFVFSVPPILGAATGGALTALLSLLQLLTVGATIVAAFLAPSNEYFAAARR